MESNPEHWQQAATGASMKTKPDASESRKRRRLAGVAIAACLVSLGLWLWTCGVYYRPLPTPCFALRLPYLTVQASALDSGVHLLAMKGRSDQTTAIGFQPETSLGRGGYGHGWVVSAVGLVFVLAPAFDGGDYGVSPHLALVLPYWLLALGSGWLSWRLVRPGRVSHSVAG